MTCEHTYLVAFKAAIVDGKADSIMCVYNSVNGAPGCASEDLLEKRLREQWGFKGFVVSDCGAIADIYRSHKYVATEGDAAVAAVKAGTDLTCGGEYRSLLDEVKAGHITEAEITRAAERLFTARMRLGMFDPPDRVPYSKIAYSENDSAEHRQLSLTCGARGHRPAEEPGRLPPSETFSAHHRRHRTLCGRSGGSAGQLQRHLFEAGHAARRDSEAILRR